MAVCVGIRVLVGGNVAVGVAVGGAEKGVEQPSGTKVKRIRMQNLIMLFMSCVRINLGISVLLQERVPAASLPLDRYDPIRAYRESLPVKQDGEA